MSPKSVKSWTYPEKRLTVIRKLLKKAILTDTLLHKSCRVPNLKNRVDAKIEQVVVDHAVREHGHGQVRASNDATQEQDFCFAKRSA